MFRQKELPGIKPSPLALYPPPGERFIVEGFEGFSSGSSEPESEVFRNELYTREEIYKLFWYHYKPFLTFSEDNLPTMGYDANLLEYIRTFILPLNNSPQLKSKVLYPLKRDLEGEVIMNGVFNGIPHPGWIEAFSIVKDRYPQKKLIVGIGANEEAEYVKGQVSEGDTAWRASLLVNTGLVDGVFVTPPYIFESLNYEYPNMRQVSANTRDRNQTGTVYNKYWSELLAGKADKLSSNVVVVNGGEELERKSLFLNPGIEIFDLSEQKRLFSDFHSQDVERHGRYSAEYVIKCWEILRREHI